LINIITRGKRKESGLRVGRVEELKEDREGGRKEGEVS